MRTAVRSAALIAFSVACGYAKLILFPYLFFVELFSVAVFLSGVIVGVGWGIWVAAAARLIFSVANPLGPPHLWVLAAQVVGAALLGALGGVARRALGASWLQAAPPRAAFLGICGLLGTTAYDLLTNLAQGKVFGAVRATLALAALPSLQHIASNTAIFVVVGGLAASWLRRDPRLLGHAALAALATLVAAAGTAAPAAAPAAPSAPAPAESTVTRPMPLVDSTAVPGGAIPVLDSTVVLPKLVRNLPSGAPPESLPRPDTLGLIVRADAGRKHGDLSVAQLLEGRRPVWVERAPGFAPLFGSPRLLDTGTPVTPDPGPIAADRATDRTVISDFTHEPFGTGLVLGVPGLATAWDIPETRGIESFDAVALDSSLAPRAFRGAGDLFARPEAVLFSSLAMPDPPAPYRVRSTLLYRKGAGSLLDTAARFSSPLFAHGIAGAYARHAGEALDPLLSSLSTHYALAAGLTRGGALRSWVEGRLFKMRMESNYPGGYGSVGFTTPTHGRAEWASREASLHALWTGGGMVASGVLRAGKAQATQVRYDGDRDRWSFPEITAEARLSGGADWSWSIGGTGSSRRVDYRSSGVAFRPLVRSGRVEAALRRGMGEGSVEAVAAGDVREGDPTLVDGRVSLWGERGRARYRLDAESAHERPSLVDLLTPARSDTMPSFIAPTLVLAQGGNPTLGARSLRGLLGAAAYRVRPGVELVAFGSARHVSDDFGWAATRSVFGDTIFIVDAARERGDGWVFQASAGGDAAFGPFTARGLGWVRGGKAGLSPQAGSPPRVGADGSLGLRATFFQGDLPLELELAGHATGPRRGLPAAPALATWDARLHVDFGSAGIFATVTNLFDAEVPSAVYRIDLDRGAPLPGRSLTAGVVWYIQD